jgi:predicted RNA-binding protein with EMAP domain
MDFKDKINEIVEKIKSDKDFAAKFKDDPVKAIESVSGLDLPDDMINKAVDAVKAKLTTDKAGDMLGGIKKLF